MKQIFKYLTLISITFWLMVAIGCKFEPNPQEPEIDYLTIKSLPNKTTYYLNQEIDLTGLEITIFYTDGSSELASEFCTDTTVLTTLGTQAIIVYLKSQPTHQVTFDVVVELEVFPLEKVEITKLPHQLNYSFNQELNLEGLEITAFYQDQSTVIIEDYRCSTKYLLVSGDYLVTIEVNLDQKYFLEFYVYVGTENVNSLSYVSDLGDYQLNNEASVLNNQQYPLNLLYTVNNIFHGGFRNTNTIVYYDASNYRSTNSYGYEIAVDENGIVIEKAVNVSLPNNGFILSGHSAGGNILGDNLEIGDYVVYQQEEGKAYVYQHQAYASILKIKDAINNLSISMNQSYQQLIPLDYQLITDLFYQLVDIYNQNVDTLSADQLVDIDQLNQETSLLIIKINYLLVEYLAVENKGFWHYPMTLSAYGFGETSKEEVCRLLDYIVMLGFNQVVINTNIGGFAIYPSQYLPKRGSIAPYYDYGEYGNDYLLCFVEEAHKRGLKVNAWTQTLMCGDGYLPSHIKDSWVLRDYSGKMVTGVYFYDILNPEVRQFLINVYSELARNYNLDALEYDIIRYPVSRLYQHNNAQTIQASDVIDNGYTEVGMANFMQEYGYSGDLKSLILTSPVVRKNWIAYKMNTLTAFVGELSDAIRQANPQILITAAVINTASTAKQVYLQDWATWAANGYVDYVEPMIYTDSNNSSYQSALNGLNVVSGTDTLFNSGLSPMLGNGTVIDLAKQISLLRGTNAAGYIIFSNRLLFSQVTYCQALVELAIPTVKSTFDDQDTITASYILNLINELVNFYMVADPSYNYQELVDLLEMVKDYQDLVDYQTQIINLINAISNSTVKNRLLNNFNRFLVIVK